MRTPVGGGAPVTWTYSYTYGHRLGLVQNNAVSPLTASYHYDSDDRRTKKVVNGVTTRTLWSGTDELAEYDVNGDLIRRFIPDGTGTMDARLATVTSSGEVFWQHTDHQGSVIATSDSAGKTVGTATYSPHGEGAPPAQSPFGYTGRQYDPETGLYYNRARYYSPYLGQFLTRDPIGTKDDPNLYMYVGLDPANATDPTGRQQAIWTSPSTVTFHGTYQLRTVPVGEGASGVAHGEGSFGFTGSQLEARVAADLSGTVDYNGSPVSVTTTVTPFDPSQGGNADFVFEAHRSLAGAEVNRAHTNRIGGDVIRVEPSDDQAVASHEVGHGFGAGDQYSGGVSAAGTVLTSNVPGAPNIMREIGPAGANPQTLREMIDAPTTQNICLSSGDSANGRC